MVTAEQSVSHLQQRRRTSKDGRSIGLTGLQCDIRGLERVGSGLLVVALARAKEGCGVFRHALVIGEDGLLLHRDPIAGKVGILEDASRIAAHAIQALGALRTGALLGLQLFRADGRRQLLLRLGQRVKASDVAAQPQEELEVLGRMLDVDEVVHEVASRAWRAGAAIGDAVEAERRRDPRPMT